ncbi:MAG: cupin domain-containing protein [Gammaproteobacteria bacterium]
MTAIDRNRIAERWAARGFSCELWIDPPGQRWEGYSHAVDELVLVLEGELELEIDHRVSRPPIGEECLIPARALHSVRNVGAVTARWLYGYYRG